MSVRLRDFFSLLAWALLVPYGCTLSAGDGACADPIIVGKKSAPETDLESTNRKTCGGMHCGSLPSAHI